MLTDDATQNQADLNKALKKTSIANVAGISTAIGVVIGGGFGLLTHKFIPQHSAGVIKEPLLQGGQGGILGAAIGYAIGSTENRKIDQISPHISRLQAERDGAQSKLAQVENTLHPESSGVGR